MSFLPVPSAAFGRGRRFWKITCTTSPPLEVYASIQRRTMDRMPSLSIGMQR
jgi:hypothetical protein